jgi:hypothetical protein
VSANPIASWKASAVPTATVPELRGQVLHRRIRDNLRH